MIIPRSTWTNLFPPKPQFTAADLPDLAGKVYIVTGANAGVGKELTRILYARNGTVYVAARSEQKASLAMQAIRRSTPNSKGTLKFLHLDLADMAVIKLAAEKFLAREGKLHVLFNNAGVWSRGSAVTDRTAQGYEIHLGVNCLGSFLFTRLLTPTLAATANVEAADSVRVVWVSSFAAELLAPRGVGIPLDNLEYHFEKSVHYKYAISKVGNWAHGVEFARRFRAAGIVSVPLCPGIVSSQLFRHRNPLSRLLLRMVTYPTLYGALTELFAGFSPRVGLELSGAWVIPFGRLHRIRTDLEVAARTEAEGGTSMAQKFWEWSEDQVRPFLSG